MTAQDRLRTLGHRWWLLAWCAAVGTIGAGLPDPPPEAALRDAPYAASVTLIRDPAAPPPPSGTDAGQQLELAAQLAERIDVAGLAAGRLGTGADPLALAATVDADADGDAGTVTVTARAADRDTAIATAQAFGAATVTYLGQSAALPLRPIGSTTVIERGWLHWPVTRPLRAAAGAGTGLAAGLLLGLAVPRRRHERLTDAEAFEGAYGAPVVAEIPRLHASVRGFGDLAVPLRPNGHVAESYRGLRSFVLRPYELPPGLAHVVAVTSPRPEDGRSTVVGNLAAALAEAGRSVLVVDADFGHPTAHLYLGTPPYSDAPEGPGLAELLQSPDPAYGISASLRPTVVPGVGLISAGQSGRLPTSVLLGMPTVLAEARRCADVVLIDAPPALTSQDAVDLLQHADTVLVTGRPGRTTAAHARRAAFVVGRAGVRIAGVVVLGSGVRDREVRPTYSAAVEPPPAPPPPPRELPPGPSRG